MLGAVLVLALVLNLATALPASAGWLLGCSSGVTNEDQVNFKTGSTQRTTQSGSTSTIKWDYSSYCPIGKPGGSSQSLHVRAKWCHVAGTSSGAVITTQQSVNAATAVLQNTCFQMQWRANNYLTEGKPFKVTIGHGW